MRIRIPRTASTSVLLLSFIPIALSSCDQTSTSVGGDKSVDGEKPSAVNHIQAISPGNNPLIARSHLPMPERLIGLRFISTETGDKGFAPGPIGDGHYFLEFGVGWLRWIRADVGQPFQFKMDGMGVLTATREEETVEGSFNQTTGEIMWGGKSYRIYVEPKKGAMAGDDSPPALSEIPGGLKINLESPRRESKTVGVGLGSLRVETLGHHDGFCVFDYTPECEGGFSVYRHRIPIREKSATIKVNDQVEVTASFDTKQSKLLELGNVHFPPTVEMYLYWSQKNFMPNLFASIQDVRVGDGELAEVGKTIKVQCMFYTDRNYVKLHDKLKQGQEVSFEISKDDNASLLDLAAEGMKTGGWRRVAGSADSAKKLRLDAKAVDLSKGLFVELKLVDLE